MKKMKRMLAMVLSVVILIGMMTSIAYASVNQVVISIPSRNVSTSYKAYNESWRAEDNKVVLYVKEDEFPIYATLYGSNGSKQEYEFDSYGTKQLEDTDPGGGTVLLYATTFLVGGPLWIPEPKVYATIVIASPQEEKPKVESIIPPNPEKELEAKLKPLLDRVKENSNDSYPEYTHNYYIKNYASGKWDGTVEYTSSGLSYHSINNRRYRWSGYGSNDVDVNIDYLGSLDMVTNQYFTFAVNYNTGEVEQWVLLEKKDSWKLQLAEDEKIDRVYASYEIPENELQGTVFTNDSNGNMHMYWLFPNKEVRKIQ